MGRYRRSNWYCGICGSEFDEDDNAIIRCSCGTFYGECCARECIICNQSFSPSALMEEPLNVVQVIFVMIVLLRLKKKKNVKIVENNYINVRDVIRFIVPVVMQ